MNNKTKMCQLETTQKFYFMGKHFRGSLYKELWNYNHIQKTTTKKPPKAIAKTNKASCLVEPQLSLTFVELKVE